LIPITPSGNSVNGGESGPYTMPAVLSLENSKNIEMAMKTKLIQVACEESGAIYLK
jgi:hypothetical protein